MLFRSRERRRGIAGTILVHKIAGAAAESGLQVDEVARLARLAAEDVGSMGIAFEACTLPAVGKPGFTLSPNEIEVGLGIHGEQGVRRAAMEPADALSEQVLDAIVTDRSLKQDAQVVLVVNGLGATTPMELSILARAAIRGLRRRGIVVARAWCGTLLSALDMAGFSLSVMTADEGRLARLDATTNAAAWPGSGRIGREATQSRSNDPLDTSHTSAAEPDEIGAAVRRAALAAADALVAAEARLAELDSVAGDGDLGASMKRAAEAIRALPASAFSSGSAGLNSIGAALRRAIGGSSGPFYAVGLVRASRALNDMSSITPLRWADAFIAAVDAVADLGGARPGDRTMLDALQPAADAFRNGILAGHGAASSWHAAVSAAEKGVRETATMLPRLGRASYLGSRALGFPDAGAAAVLEWLKAIGSITR